MPLVLSDSKTYFWKIELEVPTDDGFKEKF
jgi:hypothetical protein